MVVINIPHSQIHIDNNITILNEVLTKIKNADKFSIMRENKRNCHLIKYTTFNRYKKKKKSCALHWDSGEDAKKNIKNDINLLLKYHNICKENNYVRNSDTISSGPFIDFYDCIFKINNKEIKGYTTYDSVYKYKMINNIGLQHMDIDKNVLCGYCMVCILNNIVHIMFEYNQSLILTDNLVEQFFNGKTKIIKRYEHNIKEK